MSIKTNKNKRIYPNLKKLPIREYFMSLPKAERSTVIISSPKEDLVATIAEATNRGKHTARTWLLGTRTPSSRLECQIVADILQSDVDILFPNKKEA